MLSDIKNEIKGLNPNKATMHNNIPPKILWQSAKSLQTLCNIKSNEAISSNNNLTVSFLKI